MPRNATDISIVENLFHCSKKSIGQSRFLRYAPFLYGFQRVVLDLADFPLQIDPGLKPMDAALFRDAPLALKLPEKQHV